MLTRWKLNYFILNKTILSYFNQKGGTHLGTIHLKISSIVLIPDDPLRIIINSGTKEINLRAENISEKIKWVNALRTEQENSCKQEENNSMDFESIVREDPNVNKETKNYFEKSDLNAIQDSLAEIWTLQAHMEEVLSLLFPKIEKSSQQNDLLAQFRTIVLNLKVLKPIKNKLKRFLHRMRLRNV